MNELVGRAGLAKILDSSESTTRYLQDAGKIAPEMVIGNRPLFSVEKALALRAERDAARGSRAGQAA
jgi:hypothetical protein